MGRTREKHDKQGEGAGTAEGPTPEEDASATPEPDEESDADDEHSLHRLDEWMTREHDRCANDWERMNEAAEPLGRVEFGPDEVIDARAMSELGRTSQMGPVRIDSRLERMDDEDNIPESEYRLLEESRVRIVEVKLEEHETSKMLNRGWIAVERDQLEAVAATIEKKRINSAQAIAAVMMIIGARIGECRMRDLTETMSQTTEVPSRGRPSRR